MTTLAEARTTYDAAKAAAVQSLNGAYREARERDEKCPACAAEREFHATKAYDAAMGEAARQFEQATGYAPDSPAIR